MGVDLPKLVAGLVWAQREGARHVAMLGEVNAEFKNLEVRWRKKLNKHFSNYGIPGTSMPKEHFNSEGRFPTGGKRSMDLQIYAFKAFQHRLYGPVVGINGIETFVGLKLIEDKKRNRADQDLLKRIAKSFAEYVT